MGFIENLKRQRAEREAAEALRQRLLGEQQARASQAAQELARLEGERKAAEIKRAKEFMEKSEFPQLVTDLHALIGGNIKALQGEGSDHILRLEWDLDLIHKNNGYRSYTVGNALSVDFFPDGAINVVGNKIYALPYREWIGNKEVQEDALGKVYSNPSRFERYIPDESSLREPHQGQ